MKITFNEDSIKVKLSQWETSSAGQKAIKAAGEKAVLSNAKGKSPEAAAEKFISVLRKTIISSGLSEDAREAISRELDYLSPQQLSNGRYQITVTFGGSLSRPSLSPSRYGGIDDIVLLLNNGVDHTMKPVYGEWHGKKIRSKTTISGANFIENAISDFMGNYAKEYGVISIEPEL